MLATIIGRILLPMAMVMAMVPMSFVYAEGETDMQTVVAEMLIEKDLKIAVAESCTGGLVASKLIEYPGISEVLLEGCVTYSNDAKMRRLGVKAETLEQFGAVSEETAAEMAEGIAKTSGADIGIATTGIAGPGGGSEEKPVGLVYMGLYYKGKTYVKKCNFAGKRQAIRERATYTALDWLRKAMLNEE